MATAGPRARPAHRGPGRAGFTLLELVIALAIAALLAGMATPSLRGYVLQHRLTAVSRGLSADLALARHEAVRRGVPVHLVTRVGASADWCYALALQAQADCRQPLVGNPMLIRSVQGADHPGVALLSAGPLWLDPREAPSPASAGPVQFGIDTGAVQQVQLSPMGRATLCTASAVQTGKLPRCAEPKTRSAEVPGG